MIGTLAIVSLTQFISSPPSKEQIEAVGTAAEAISNAMGYIGELPGSWR